jgi:hypothetical protein
MYSVSAPDTPNFDVTAIERAMASEGAVRITSARSARGVLDASDADEEAMSFQVVIAPIGYVRSRKPSRDIVEASTIPPL